MRTTRPTTPTRRQSPVMMMATLEGREMCSMAMLGPAHLVGPSPAIEVKQVSVPLNPEYKAPAGLLSGNAFRKVCAQVSPVLPVAPVAHINVIRYIGPS